VTDLDEHTGKGTDLFQPGNMVGRYRLLGPLATGGMAQIWAARNDHNRFGRTIVLKVIRPEYATDVEYRRMLVDEATAASAVHHPNVCEILELGNHEDVLFMAMEWVAGDSLAGLIRRGSERHPFPYTLAARIVANACSGLHAAHEATDPNNQPLKIVHRDISPQNLLLSISGQVKVSDFGIAKARDQLHSKTRTGSIKGKFAYIPPEQVRGKGVDRRADIYAMGCVLYVATTGLRPFGSSPSAALSKILRGDFKKPSLLTIDYPESLEGIVLKALALRAEDRYQTADELRVALERWLAQCGVMVTETDIAQAVKSRLSDTVKQQIRALRNAPQFLREISSYRPRKLSEATETPTAGTGIRANAADLGPEEPTVNFELDESLGSDEGAPTSNEPTVIQPTAANEADQNAEPPPSGLADAKNIPTLPPRRASAGNEPAGEPRPTLRARPGVKR
jgi:eukaryotic-like serine/threonine-protein kinase